MDTRTIFGTKQQAIAPVPKKINKTPYIIVTIVTIVIIIVIVLVAYFCKQNETLLFSPYIRDPATTLHMYQPLGAVTQLSDTAINNRRILVCQSLSRLKNASGTAQSINYATATYSSLNCDAYPLSAWID
jgi:hypothetical protein